jgi:putative phage-type endonuclease
MTTLPVTIGDAELVGTFVHDTPEWHAARAAVIGSSDIASILGLSSFKSAYTLWHEKAGLIEPTRPDVKWQRKLDYGHYMEPFVAAQFVNAYAAETETNLSLGVTGSWRNIERPWQGANPDRLVFPAKVKGRASRAFSVAELKTFPMVDVWPSPGYVAQLRWQLDVFGFTRGFLVGYANMSGDLLWEEIEVDPFEADSVRARALAFANSITEGTPPDIDGSADTYATIRRLNPSITPKVEADIPADIAEAYLAARDNAKAAESEVTKWKGHLLAHMGTAQYALYDGRKIASRVAVRDGVPYLKEA